MITIRRQNKRLTGKWTATEYISVRLQYIFSFLYSTQILRNTRIATSLRILKRQNACSILPNNYYEQR